jgi:outer membrane protein TolC
LTLALNDNPVIKNACDTVRGARYGLDIAQAEFGFRLAPQATSGLGTDTETSQSTIVNLSKKFSSGTTVELSSGTSASDKSFYRSFTGVTISQSLFRGWGSLLNTNNVVEAKRRIVTTERQAALTKEEVIMEVIATFYLIVRHKLALGIWERSLERSQQLLAASYAKLERGLATKIDTFRVQSQIATAERGMLDAQESLLEAKDALKLLLNKDLAEEIDVETQIIPVAVTQEEKELVETALQRRLDVLEMTDQVRDAERNAHIAQRSLYPDLRVGFNYSLTGRGGNFADSVAFDNSRFRVLFSTSIPLSLTAERAQSQQRQLELVRKKREQHVLYQKVTQEVRQALRHVATVEKRITIQEKEIQVTRANLELASFRFERGYADMIEVLRAEDGLTQAQREEIILRVEQVGAAMQLRKAAGLVGAFLDTLLEGAGRQEPCPQQTPFSEVAE